MKGASGWTISYKFIPRNPAKVAPSDSAFFAKTCSVRKVPAREASLDRPLGPVLKRGENAPVQRFRKWFYLAGS